MNAWHQDWTDGPLGCCLRSRDRRREGQAITEVSLVIFLITLIFLGLFQVSRLYAAREILHHAAARGARARTVGFSGSMVQKTIMVGLIPVAGRMTVPDYEVVYQDLRDSLARDSLGSVWDLALTKVPDSERHRIERTRIPEFLGSDNVPDGRTILDYADWDDIDYNARAPVPNAAFVHVTAEYDYPLRVPLHRTFVAADRVHVFGESYLENHFESYMDDEGR
jgi:hypothetical protein